MDRPDAVSEGKILDSGRLFVFSDQHILHPPDARHTFRKGQLCKARSGKCIETDGFQPVGKNDARQGGIVKCQGMDMLYTVRDLVCLIFIEEGIPDQGFAIR